MMTRPDRKRTVAIEVTHQPTSTGYGRAASGEQALAAHELKASKTSSSPPKKVKVPRPAAVPLWFLSDRKFLERHLGEGVPFEKCAAEVYRELYPDRFIKHAQAVLDQLTAHGEKKIVLKFIFARKSQVKYPAAPRKRRKLAEKIAAQIERLARKQPEFVEEVVTDYIGHVHSNNRMMLTSDKRAPQIRDYMKFVNKLKMKELKITFTGFSHGSIEPDLKPALRSVGLPENTPITYVIAPNQEDNGDAALNHLAVNVGCGPESESCGAFRYAMTMAAIAQIWRPQEEKIVRKRKRTQSIQPAEGTQQLLFK